MSHTLPRQDDQATLPVLEESASWSQEAQQAFVPAYCAQKPYILRPIEENTVPSWLWRHSGEIASGTDYENAPEEVIHRVVGSCVYAAWKKNLLPTEQSARTTYEALYNLFSLRKIAMEPSSLTAVGLDWAYGVMPVPVSLSQNEEGRAISLSNAAIDAILAQKDNGAQAQWNKLLSLTGGKRLTVHFADTMHEWDGKTSGQGTRLAFDLLQFCRPEDGLLDTTALGDAIDLAVLLLEIHYPQLVSMIDDARPLSMGFVNLHPFLMRQGKAYDSAQGRGLAAAVTSFITGRAIKASAELAKSFGVCQTFTAQREAILCALTNRRRAAYGDKNDYEHVSVLPKPLMMDDCTDLSLLAATRYTWDSALIAAKRYGLRHAQVTSLFASPEIAACLGSSIMPLAPEMKLTREISQGDDVYRQEIHPVVFESLIRLGYSEETATTIIRHATGHGTIKTAPTLNHESLKAKGFDDDALARLEACLTRVNSLSLACTPWIVGETFCRTKLSIPAELLQDFGFDLLSHIGFSAEDIATANQYCFGSGTIHNCADLKPEHRALFACSSALSRETEIKMAAAIQVFVTGDTSLVLSLDRPVSVETRSALLIDAWKQGLKAVTLYFNHEGANRTTTLSKGKPAPQSAYARTTAIAAAPRHVHGKATTKIIRVGERKTSDKATRSRNESQT